MTLDYLLRPYPEMSLVLLAARPWGDGGNKVMANQQWRGRNVTNDAD